MTELKDKISPYCQDVKIINIIGRYGDGNACLDIKGIQLFTHLPNFRSEGWENKHNSGPNKSMIGKTVKTSLSLLFLKDEEKVSNRKKTIKQIPMNKPSSIPSDI